LLISRLEHAIERAKRYNSLGAVLFVDLDHFKSVNDNFGHSAGDDLLIDVGGRLSECLRDIDTLARIGGDEFVIVLEDIPDRGAAAIVADNVVARMRAPFFLRNGKTAHIGASVGISVFTADGDAAAELMEHADAALYSAKQSGRNMYRFFREPE
jgi:diguanylate cyclase (GGDEF)-like protein